MLRYLAPGLLFAFFSGCSSDVPGVGCTSDADCGSGAVCIDTVCFANQCEPACGESQHCHRASCTADFVGVRIVEPASGATLGASFDVVAELEAAEGFAGTPPESVKLELGHVSGVLTEVALAHEEGLRFRGTAASVAEGRYKLAATIPAIGLRSEQIDATVAWCATACAAGHECAASGCVPTFAKIGLAEPQEAAVIGPSGAKVRATLERAPETKGDGPAVAELLVTVGARTDPVLLTKTASGDYEGQWTPAQSGTHTLKARSAVLGLESAPVIVEVDLTPPVFSLRLTNPPNRQQHELDPDPNYGFALRRDEMAVVELSSADGDVDLSTVKLIAKGATGTTTLDVALADAATCATGAKFCKKAEVTLWDAALEMKAPRGEFEVTVNGTDAAGNPASESLKFKVTRWKWAFQGQAFKAAPAVGAKGDIYIGEAVPNGKVYAVGPDGVKKWEYATAGMVTSSVAVGDVGGAEKAFAAGTYKATGSSSGVGAIWALDGTPAGETPVCTGGESALASIGITYSRLAAEPVATATAIGVLNDASGGGFIVAARPQGQISCVQLYSQKGAAATSGVAISGAELYFGDRAGGVQSLTLDSSTASWNPRSGWPVALGGGNAATNLIASPTAVLGSGTGVGVGRLFVIPSSGGTGVTMDTQGPTGNAVLDSGQQLLAGTEDGKLVIASKSLQGSQSTVALSGAITAAPLVGSDKHLYVSTRAGRLYSLDASAGTNWTVELGSASDSSPSIDCARKSDGSADPGKPGTLYVGTDAGKLIAIVVDSRGLDTTAPWPRFHRDPRNTGDASVDLSVYACP